MIVRPIATGPLARASPAWCMFTILIVAAVLQDTTIAALPVGVEKGLESDVGSRGREQLPWRAVQLYNLSVEQSSYLIGTSRVHAHNASAWLNWAEVALPVTKGGRVGMAG